MVGVGGPGPEGISHIPVFGSKFRGCQYHDYQQPTFKGSFEPFRHRIWGIQRWLALFETTFTFQVTQEAEVQRRPKLVFYTSMKVGFIIPVPFQYSLVGLLWIRLLDSYGWSNLTFCVCGKHKHLEMCVVTCRGASDPRLRRWKGPHDQKPSFFTSTMTRNGWFWSTELVGLPWFTTLHDMKRRMDVMHLTGQTCWFMLDKSRGV